MSDRIRQAAAVWAVLHKARGTWLTALDITQMANTELAEKDPKARAMTTAGATARVRDFRKPRYGGQTIVCKRVAGFSAPVYQLIIK